MACESLSDGSRNRMEAAIEWKPEPFVAEMPDGQCTVATNLASRNVPVEMQWNGGLY